MKNQKTLGKFLKKYEACDDVYDFAKDLTIEQFLATCPRGDWILWLFENMNKESIRELTLAAGHCANTVREYMKDERSIKAVDVAIAFGEGKATMEELDMAARGAYSAAGAAYYAAGAVAWAAWTAYYAAAYASTWATAGVAASYAANASAWASAAAKKANEKLTADICRKYLPLEIWHISKLD